MLTYAQYKTKHDWATESIATFEGRLADGRPRLEATLDELKIAENERNAAAQANKPTEVTAAELAQVESSDQRVTELRKLCDDIEKENEVNERGINESREFLTELDAQYPEHNEQLVYERNKEAPDTSDMSNTAKGFQAYAAGAALAVSLNSTMHPEMPSNVEMFRAVDPAAREKQELSELDFETLPTSQRDQIRQGSQPLEDSIEEQHPPERPVVGERYEVGASNDPNTPYSVPLPREYGASDTPGQQSPQPVEGPKDDVPLLTYDKADQKLLTYDKADQKLLTYEDSKPVIDERKPPDESIESAVPALPPEANESQPRAAVSAPPPPDESVPPPAPEQPERQPTGPSL